MLKRITHRIAIGLERVADRMFHRTAAGRAIDAYIGYATGENLILRGRVLSKLRHATAAQSQTRLGNMRQIFQMFLTDEVRDAVVHCRNVTATTDEEGYFTLTLPRSNEAGWITENVSVEGAAGVTACPALVPRNDAKFMVISDIDDTMLETGAYSLARNLYTSFTGNAQSRHVFQDSVTLMNQLSQDGQNPVFYVSSSPWNLHDFLSDIFENSRLVRGPMFLRDLGLSKTKFITEGHSNHKSASIDTILRANPTLPAILLGDTGQHDAQIYLDIIKRHKDRILAVGLRAPGPGLDTADHRDLSDLKLTDVPTYAAPSFDGFLSDIAAQRPELAQTVCKV